MARTMARLAVGAVAMVGTLLGGALAQPSPASAAVTCYGGAVNWTYSGGTKELGPYTASSRCIDINLKTNSNYVVACVVFIDRTNLCNRNDTMQVVGPQWTAIATDVLNGTRFKVRLKSYGLDASGGKLAY